MKTIDTKSLLLGVVATLLIFVLTSSKSSDDNNGLVFVPSAGGMGVYNPQSKMLYLYKMWNLKINLEPSQILKPAEDGSSFTEIK